MIKLRKIVFAIFFMSLVSGVALLDKSLANGFCGMKNYSVLTTYELMRASDIEYRYRKYRGNLQYRRWDLKKKKWLDSHWIDV